MDPDIRAEIAAPLIDLLHDGGRPWEAPTDPDGEPAGLPLQSSGRLWRGVSALSLWTAAKGADTCSRAG